MKNAAFIITFYFLQ